MGVPAAMIGSSPRARGTGRPPPDRRDGVRLIPAGAGNGSSGRRRTPRAAAHPRGRGERASGEHSARSSFGSSPRARGTGRGRRSRRRNDRLIPAGAGNGREGAGTTGRLSAHPRGRGERASAAGRQPSKYGSSPRARGTGLLRQRRGRVARLIPAGAGNGTSPRGRSGRWPAHPRGRGERRQIATVSSFSDGSSPRARGTGALVGAERQEPRLIPAGAGNGSAAGQRRPLPAHPRGRGERGLRDDRGRSGGSSPRARGTGDRRALERSSSGSSPRARGTVDADVRGEVRVRLIPAGAGNGLHVGPDQERLIPAGAGNGSSRGRSTPSPAHPRGRGERGTRDRWGWTAHPRGRGERPNRLLWAKWPNGSSPRARGTGGSPCTRSATAAAHPRGRGERRPRMRHEVAGRGSSPRARGTGGEVGVFAEGLRLIPAGAGNGCRRPSGRWGCAAHPRGRGERASFMREPGRGYGSSPRARGTAGGAAAGPDVDRLIPAGAGNGPGTPRRSGAPPAHPRGRGERKCWCPWITAATGSSPRARGTGGSSSRSRVRLRLIPAGAGNGCGRRSRARAPSAHPRGRGERGRRANLREVEVGSSPRARGTVLGRVAREDVQRLIPAGAGNGRAPSQPRRGGPAHPRGRGERGLRLPALGLLHRLIPAGAGNGRARRRAEGKDAGSSPRARGTGALDELDHRRLRLIPAGAGNGMPLRARCRPRPAHPRGRGERWSVPSAAKPVDGSSPRARGTEPRRVADRVRDRLIPAGAGNGLMRIVRMRASAAHPRGRGERSTSWKEPDVWDGSSPRARGTGSPRSPPRPGTPAHPRGRGERRFIREGGGFEPGSSPRARGTVRVASRALPLVRLIPAGAGNGRVHGPYTNGAPGSSPRARGTGQEPGGRRLERRLIPAGAGNG